VAIRDPRQPDRSLGVLAVGWNASVSTSGNYERDFGREGWRAPSHIYDPRTGDPARADLAVTAWAPDATTADALSTALLVLGVEHAGPLLAREPDAGALFVDTSGGRAEVVLAGRAPVRFAPADGVAMTTAPGVNVTTASAVTLTKGDSAR
jgi:thiamine biosynthesis lipoprotein ApbE